MAQSRKKQPIKKQFYLATWKQVLLGLFILVSVLAFSALFVLEVAIQPFETASDNAKKIATEYAHLQTITQVQQYNGLETYYAVSGVDQEDKQVLVLVPETSEAIYVLDSATSLSREKAETIALQNGAEAVQETVLGVYEEKAIWEVRDGTAYYLIDAETGELVKKEGI